MPTSNSGPSNITKVSPYALPTSLKPSIVLSLPQLQSSAPQRPPASVESSIRTQQPPSSPYSHPPPTSSQYVQLVASAPPADPAPQSSPARSVRNLQPDSALSSKSLRSPLLNDEAVTTLRTDALPSPSNRLGTHSPRDKLTGARNDFVFQREEEVVLSKTLTDVPNTSGSPPPVQLPQKRSEQPSKSQSQADVSRHQSPPISHLHKESNAHALNVQAQPHRQAGVKSIPISESHLRVLPHPSQSKMHQHNQFSTHQLHSQSHLNNTSMSESQGQVACGPAYDQIKNNQIDHPPVISTSDSLVRPSATIAHPGSFQPVLNKPSIVDIDQKSQLCPDRTYMSVDIRASQTSPIPCSFDRLLSPTLNATHDSADALFAEKCEQPAISSTSDLQKKPSIIARGQSISLARRAATTAKRRREQAQAEWERKGNGMSFTEQLDLSAATRANVSQNKNKGKRSKRVKWSDTEVDALRQGVKRFGRGRWAVILREYASDFHEVRISVDLKDKWRNLSKLQPTGKEDAVSELNNIETASRADSVQAAENMRPGSPEIADSSHVDPLYGNDSQGFERVIKHPGVPARPSSELSNTCIPDRSNSHIGQETKQHNHQQYYNKKGPHPVVQKVASLGPSSGSKSESCPLHHGENYDIHCHAPTITNAKKNNGNFEHQNFLEFSSSSARNTSTAAGFLQPSCSCKQELRSVSDDAVDFPRAGSQVAANEVKTVVSAPKSSLGCNQPKVDNIEKGDEEPRSSALKQQRVHSEQCGSTRCEQKDHDSGSSALESHMRAPNCEIKQVDDVRRAGHETVNRVDHPDLILEHLDHSNTARIAQYRECYPTEFEARTEKQPTRKGHGTVTHISVHENNNSCLAHQQLNGHTRKDHEGSESASAHVVEQQHPVHSTNIACIDSNQSNFEQGVTDLQSDDEDEEYVQHVPADENDRLQNLEEEDGNNHERQHMRHTSVVHEHAHRRSPLPLSVSGSPVAHSGQDRHFFIHHQERRADNVSQGMDVTSEVRQVQSSSSQEQVQDDRAITDARRPVPGSMSHGGYRNEDQMRPHLNDPSYPNHRVVCEEHISDQYPVEDIYHQRSSVPSSKAQGGKAVQIRTNDRGALRRNGDYDHHVMEDSEGSVRSHEQTFSPRDVSEDHRGGNHNNAEPIDQTGPNNSHEAVVRSPNLGYAQHQELSDHVDQESNDARERVQRDFDGAEGYGSNVMSIKNISSAAVTRVSALNGTNLENNDEQQHFKFPYGSNLGEENLEQAHGCHEVGKSSNHRTFQKGRTHYDENASDFSELGSYAYNRGHSRMTDETGARYESNYRTNRCKISTIGSVRDENVSADNNQQRAFNASVHSIRENDIGSPSIGSAYTPQGKGVAHGNACENSAEPDVGRVRGDDDDYTEQSVEFAESSLRTQRQGYIDGSRVDIPTAYNSRTNVQENVGHGGPIEQLELRAEEYNAAGARRAVETDEMSATPNDRTSASLSERGEPHIAALDDYGGDVGAEQDAYKSEGEIEDSHQKNAFDDEREAEYSTQTHENNQGYSPHSSFHREAIGIYMSDSTPSDGNWQNQEIDGQQRSDFRNLGSEASRVDAERLSSLSIIAKQRAERDDNVSTSSRKNCNSNSTSMIVENDRGTKRRFDRKIPNSESEGRISEDHQAEMFSHRNDHEANQVSEQLHARVLESGPSDEQKMSFDAVEQSKLGIPHDGDWDVQESKVLQSNEFDKDSKKE